MEAHRSVHDIHDPACRVPSCSICAGESAKCSSGAPYFTKSRSRRFAHGFPGRACGNDSRNASASEDEQFWNCTSDQTRIKGGWWARRVYYWTMLSLLILFFSIQRAECGEVFQVRHEVCFFIFQDMYATYRNPFVDASHTHQHDHGIHSFRRISVSNNNVAVCYLKIYSWKNLP